MAGDELELRTALAVLGVGAGANLSDIRRAYKSRARLLHPDRHQGSDPAVAAAATEAMQQLNDAFAIASRLLSDTTAHAHDDPVGQQRPTSGGKVRCPRCRALASIDVHGEGRCGSCGARLRAATRTAQPTSAARPAGRDFFRFLTNDWRRRKRNALKSIFAWLRIDAEWDANGFTVRGIDRDAAELAIAALESAMAPRTEQRGEFRYDVKGWSGDQLHAICQILYGLTVPWQRVGNELVIAAHDREIVGAVISAIGDRPLARTR